MVYVNRQYRFIFIENPKSGSTSILVAFEKLFKIKFMNRTPRDHKTVDQVKREIQPEIWNEYLKVSTYRDPIERAISAKKERFNYDPVFSIPQEEFIKEMDFLIKLETFQEDFDVFCQKIGVESIKLEHINKSKN